MFKLLEVNYKPLSQFLFKRLNQFCNNIPP